MDDDQPLALLFVGDRGHHYVEVAFVVAAVTDDLLEDLFDLDMRHHFAADLRESAGAVGDGDEPLRVDPGDVTRHVPAVVHDGRGLFGLVQIALHDIRAPDEEKARMVNPQIDHRIGIDDLGAGARYRAPHRSFFSALLHRFGRAVIGYVYCRDRRQLGRSVSLDGAYAELFGEGLRQFEGHLLGPHDNQVESLQ